MYRKELLIVMFFSLVLITDMHFTIFTSALGSEYYSHSSLFGSIGYFNLCLVFIFGFLLPKIEQEAIKSPIRIIVDSNKILINNRSEEVEIFSEEKLVDNKDALVTALTKSVTDILPKRFINIKPVAEITLFIDSENELNNIDFIGIRDALREVFLRAELRLEVRA